MLLITAAVAATVKPKKTLTMFLEISGVVQRRRMVLESELKVHRLVEKYRRCKQRS